MTNMYLHFQTNRRVVYLKKRFPHHEQLLESSGAAPVVVALITSLTTPKIKQYLTIKNSYFYNVAVNLRKFKLNYVANREQSQACFLLRIISPKTCFRGGVRINNIKDAKSFGSAEVQHIRRQKLCFLANYVATPPKFNAAHKAAKTLFLAKIYVSSLHSLAASKISLANQKLYAIF